ncbi:MAG: uncharacterized protein JWM95_4610 [Gemmatimonadetes bacterium]|nr:uncharacterized protein [Gemmatimonadota bacterium]
MITAESDTAVELRRARAQIAALEQLLEVHEQTSLEQTTRLEQTNRELDQFAYVASHDLKAPLRGIANLTQWIEEDLGEQLADETKKHMRLLKVRVHRMEALIEGILTYSRAGRMREKIERLDVGPMLNEAIEMLAPPATVTVRVEPPMPTLCTERVPLQQVLMNLIGNAIKYRRDAGAVVTVSAQAAGDFVRFAVSDNGPGIAPQFHDRIWQIFQTLAPRDEVEGTGIGLSVVKKLVEMRGGKVWLESEAGHGSTFRFTWPVGLETTT